MILFFSFVMLCISLYTGGTIQKLPTFNKVITLYGNFMYWLFMFDRAHVRGNITLYIFWFLALLFVAFLVADFNRRHDIQPNFCTYLLLIDLLLTFIAIIYAFMVQPRMGIFY